MAPLKLLRDELRVHDDVMQGRDPLVSVVIPTYNRAWLLERAVHSVLSQTFADLEAIVVDDASSDNTQDRIESLQQTDHRIRYIRHEGNQGAQAARNTGIRSAKGQYIAFLDSDNEWLHEKLQKQLALFLHESDSLGAVYCSYCKVSATGNILAAYKPRYRGFVYKQALSEWLTDTSTLVVRREILEKIHGLDENVRAYQEWDLCIRLARECEFDFVPECLALYHQHNLPTISKDLLRDAKGYLSLVETYRGEILRECGGRALSEHYLNAGRLFVRANRFDLARAYFLRSIRYHALSFKAIIHFGASLGGKDVYQFLRSYRQAKFPIVEA